MKRTTFLATFTFGIFCVKNYEINKYLYTEKAVNYFYFSFNKIDLH